MTIALTSAHAAESGRMLPNGFGISSPSVTTTLHGFENPAGHSEISSVKLQFIGYSSENDYNPVFYSGGLMLGNGSFGGGLAGYSYSGSNMRDEDPDYLWGLGGRLDSLGVAFGVNGTTTGGDNSDTTTKLGLLFGSRGSLTFGAVVDTDDSGIWDFGAGVSYDFSPNVNLSLDALHYRSDTKMSYAAGVHVGGGPGEVLFGYKLIDKDNEAEDHLYGGFGLTFWNSLSIQFLYNYLSTYCLGLTVRF